MIGIIISFSPDDIGDTSLTQVMPHSSPTLSLKTDDSFRLLRVLGSILPRSAINKMAPNSLKIRNSAIQEEEKKKIAEMRFSPESTKAILFGIKFFNGFGDALMLSQAPQGRRSVHVSHGSHRSRLHHVLVLFSHLNVVLVALVEIIRSGHR